MENLSKFSSPTNSSVADASACKRDTMTCVGGGTGGSGSSGGGGGGNTMSSMAPIGAVGGIGPTSSKRTVSTHTSTWLAALHVNNNNNTEKFFDHNQKNISGCRPDEARGYMTSNNGAFASGIGKFSLPLNGLASNNADDDDVDDDSPEGAACALPTAAPCLYPPTDYADSNDRRGAVSLSPLLMEDPFDEADSEAAAAAIGGGHSNRTSLNNSTENLSYTSDNFYGDDLILLGDDGDLEAEELSLNSDDCVYAYRGAGAEFDLPLPAIAGMSGNYGLLLQHQSNMAQEEETDFLEMDFDPDPPSELDYNHSESETKADHQYLMQRDACHLVTPNATQRHQLFSSPIDDLPPAPKALQAQQSLLSKNFARITLHLDQIQKDYKEEDEGQEDRGEVLDETNPPRERLNSALDSRPLEDEFPKESRSADTSHSLPNTLHEHFTNRCNSESAVVITGSKEGMLEAPHQSLGHHLKSPSKITGAKPKRLSTFSSTSSTSSKNSSKSRNSLRSTFQSSSAMGTSCSFDERSVSCSEFRTERDKPSNSTQSASLLTAATYGPKNCPSGGSVFSNQEYNVFAGDETCLDCLEKEFLANTIGKALDPFGCVKCRKRLGHLSMYNRSLTTADNQLHSHSHSQSHSHSHSHQHQQQQQQQQQQQPPHISTSKFRRSASPTSSFFFNDQTSPTSRLFSCEFLNSQARKRQEWDSYVQEQKEMASSNSTSLDSTSPASNCRQLPKTEVKELNQSQKNLETKIFKTLKPPDPCSVTINTNNITESSLVQALDKLQIATYNRDLINAYFKKLSNINNNSTTYSFNSQGSGSSSSSSATKHLKIHYKEFKNIKEFLLYVSKRQANRHKLQRLVEKVIQNKQQKIVVQFKKDPSITDMEMVPVRVSDILHYWSQCKDLECLKDMDRRFQEANILGKVANIIRQAHQRTSSSSRRPLAEFIAIPQYYPSGFLTLTKKC